MSCIKHQANLSIWKFTTSCEGKHAGNNSSAIDAFKIPRATVTWYAKRMAYLVSSIYFRWKRRGSAARWWRPRIQDSIILLDIDCIRYKQHIRVTTESGSRAKASGTESLTHSAPIFIARQSYAEVSVRHRSLGMSLCKMEMPEMACKPWADVWGSKPISLPT